MQKQLVSAFHKVARNPWVHVCFKTTELILVDLLLVTKRIFLNTQSKPFVAIGSHWKLSSSYCFSKECNKKGLWKEMLHEITVSEIHCLTSLIEKLYSIQDTLWVIIYFKWDAGSKVLLEYWSSRFCFSNYREMFCYLDGADSVFRLTTKISDSL